MVYSVVTAYREGDSYRRLNLQQFCKWHTDHFPGIELVVVEQGPVRTLLTGTLGPDVRIVYQESVRPFNKSWALNKAIRTSSNPRIYVTDCDLLATRSMVEDAISRLTGDILFSWVGSFMVDLSDVASRDPQHRGPHEGLRGIQMCAGAFAMDKWIFLSIGGFDEGFEGWGHEDIELFDRANKLLEEDEVCDPYLPVHCLKHLWHPIGSRQYVQANEARRLLKLGWSREEMRKRLPDLVALGGPEPLLESWIPSLLPS
jgi:hypothetical protein